MTNNLLPVLVTTDAVACECGEAECFFCEPFAGVSDDEMMEIIYSCPKCHAYASESHDEDCRYGIAAAAFMGGVS